eukprot:1195898-Prorocentrum_minimum.AAC.8
MGHARMPSGFLAVYSRFERPCVFINNLFCEIVLLLCCTESYYYAYITICEISLCVTFTLERIGILIIVGSYCVIVDHRAFKFLVPRTRYGTTSEFEEITGCGKDSDHGTLYLQNALLPLPRGFWRIGETRRALPGETAERTAHPFHVPTATGEPAPPPPRLRRQHRIFVATALTTSYHQAPRCPPSWATHSTLPSPRLPRIALPCRATGPPAVSQPPLHPLLLLPLTWPLRARCPSGEGWPRTTPTVDCPGTLATPSPHPTV